jgi:hypothetical protein
MAQANYVVAAESVAHTERVEDVSMAVVKFDVAVVSKAPAKITVIDMDISRALAKPL